MTIHSNWLDVKIFHFLLGDALHLRGHATFVPSNTLVCLLNFSYYKNLTLINRICPSDLKNIMFSFKTLHIVKLLAKKHDIALFVIYCAKLTDRFRPLHSDDVIRQN